MKIIKKITSSSKDTMKSLSSELESLVYSNVKENYPGNWSREIVTRSFFSDLKKLFHGKNIHTPGNTVKSFWYLHHLKNDNDLSFGDIAIVLQISYHDGQVARGVAFFDVAEKDPGKHTFTSLNKNRLRKLNSLAPHSQVLLYDYDTITGMAFPSTADSIIGNYPHSWNNWISYTHAVSVPANLAIQLDNKSTGLYKVALPISYLLCYRYLFGLDLDFSSTALDTAAGIKTNRGNPKFLILVSVCHGGAEPLNTFDFDNRKYTEFE
ncbi:MAG: hypothetical protein JW807_01065 [Spirochaetes bacterium]|nr:hypothetical protein [Spirochaetota bacterium]